MDHLLTQQSYTVCAPEKLSSSIIYNTGSCIYIGIIERKVEVNIELKILISKSFL